MFKLFLIVRYLAKRRIAWVCLAAVTLCAAMVLVVSSVMGGWLGMFRTSFRAATGDIVVRGDKSGFPYYQDMMDQIRALPEVKACTPSIRSFGLINIANQIREGVSVVAYGPDIGQVNAFMDSLHLLKGKPSPSFQLLDNVDYSLHAPQGFRGDVKAWPGMIVGGRLIGVRKGPDGKIIRKPVNYRAWTRLTLVPIRPDYSSVDLTDKVERLYWIVDDSLTGLLDRDATSVYVDFNLLQKDLEMDAQQVRERGDDGVETTRTRPARCSEILVSLKADSPLEATRDTIDKIVTGIRKNRQIGDNFPTSVDTWKEIHADFLGTIEKQRVLVTMLFGIISLVASFMIFSIFYMIVIEKTRDIGILKSIGAPARGIASVFLGYGLAIGVVGGACGLLLGWAVVRNINEMHALLGKWMGITIWVAEVYQFERIPDQLNASEAVMVFVSAIVLSVIGSLWPAIRAARLQPVEAIRFE